MKSETESDEKQQALNTMGIHSHFLPIVYNLMREKKANFQRI